MNKIALALCLPVLGAAPQAVPSIRPPYIGYVFPAGGAQGSTFEARIGGENVYGSIAAVISGKGVVVEVTDSREPESLMAGLQKKKKKAKQTVIDEIIKLKVTVAPDAEPGAREICLVTPHGLSNKRVFQVDSFKEVREAEPNNTEASAVPLPALPVLVNGQILPGDVDRFKFSARKGQQLVVEIFARALIPYIADAVPGWFQAIVSLYDPQGKEVAMADDFRFNPDPVLFYEVPADGLYGLAVRDSIYRGREDFVYRVKIGEVPFITSVFPLGAPRGDKPVTVKLTGKNLPSDTLTVPVDAKAPAVQLLSVIRDGLVSNRVPFAVGSLPEVLEAEGGKSQKVSMPVVVNGRLRAPGEKDSYAFAGKKGQTVSVDVQARRLGSPLDAYVTLFNGRGEKLAENDDLKDKAEGLLTHHADAGLVFKLPEDGTYTVTLHDTQGKGGEEYAYRLRISMPVPGFELRATPSELGVPRGGSAPLTLHAIRKDGFTGEIRVSLDKASAPGLTLDGGIIPEGSEKVRMTISASDKAAAATLFPQLQGTAVVDGKTVTCPVVPAEEFMQAFIYIHLVPAKAQVVTVEEDTAPFSGSIRLPPEGYVTLPRGKETSFPVMVTRRPGFMGPIRFQLVDPPKGVTAGRGGVLPGRDVGLMTVRVESDAEVKSTENLVISGVMFIADPSAEGARPLEKPAPKAAPDPGKPVGEGGTAKPSDKKPADPKKPAFQRVIAMFPAVPFRVTGQPEPKKTEPARESKK
jgi:hypothetical protein